MRLERQRGASWLGVVCAVAGLIVGGCGNSTSADDRNTGRSSPSASPTTSTSPHATTTTRTGTLIVDRDKRARLCRVVADSSPPICGQLNGTDDVLWSLAVENLDVSRLSGKDEYEGVTFYRNVAITGVLDGTTLVATEPARSVRR